MLSRLLPAALVAVGLSSAPLAPVLAQAPSTPVLTQQATVEGITEYSLSNGLRVLLFPDPSKPTTTVNVTYLVGSRHESYGETGMAHLLEHLVFKGTPNHPDIPAELTSHGARPNGSTWTDRTNYFETFAATPENLEWAIDLEADRMVNSFISKDDLASEFSVVRNEFESGENDPFGVLLERVMSTAYLWHNYGNTTIGARSDIEEVPIERLQAFYRRYYQPDNAVLIVAGKFDEDATLKLITEKFGAIPRPERTGDMLLWPTYTDEPAQDGERSVTLRRVGDEQVAMAAYHVPAGTHADFAAVQVLAEVLGDAPSGRLYEALVRTQQAASVGSFSWQFREPGLLMAYARVRVEDSLPVAEETMRRTIAEIVARPATDEEVERAKTALLKRFELILNDPERAGLNLSEWAALGDWRMMFLHRDRLRAVTTDDVARVATAYIRPSNLTFGRFVPEKEPLRAEIPAPPDVAALVKDYKGDTARVEGEEFDPSPANIESRTTRGTIPGGAELALLPKRTRAQRVNVAMNLRFGSLESLMGRATEGSLTGAMLMRGTRSMSRQQIKDAFDKLNAQVSIGGGATSAFVRIEAQRPNLAAVLRLVGQVLREPAFDEREFTELKTERLAQVEQGKSEPQVLAQRAFFRQLQPYPAEDPRATLTVEEHIAALNAVTLEGVRDFYADFYGADHAQVAVVGDFDPEEVSQLVTSFLGGWRSRTPFERVPSEYTPVDSGTIVINTPDKANAMFFSGTTLEMRDDAPDWPAMVIGDYMLGGGFLNSRLATRIRQKDGLSYGVGSFASASSQDESGFWATYAIYAPENAEKLTVAFGEEIARVRQDGFTAEELDAARTGWLQSREVSRSQDGSLAAMLASGLYLDRTLEFDAEIESRIRALTPDDVNAVMRSRLDPAHFATVRAGDFNKEQAPLQP